MREEARQGNKDPDQKSLSGKTKDCNSHRQREVEAFKEIENKQQETLPINTSHSLK